MSNPRTTKPLELGRQAGNLRNLLLILCGVLICSSVGLLFVGPNRSVPPTKVPVGRDSAPQETHRMGDAANSPLQSAEPAVTEHGQTVTLVDDDGKTLWGSPTNGPPLDAAYLAAGAQIIMSMRPQALMQHEEGAKSIATLGPLGEQGVASLEGHSYVPFAQIDRLLVGSQASGEGRRPTSTVIRTAQPLTLGKLSRMHGRSTSEYRDQTYLVIGHDAYYLPRATTLVIAPTETIADIIDLSGEPPPLRRDMERLLRHTDADRHVTILFTPTWLFSEGQSMFTGQMAGLREPLFWFLGDELSAVALSLHWDEDFFVELIAVPTLDTSPERASRILAERFAQVPDKLEAYLATLKPQPYGREILSRFPAMVRALVKYTRSGFEPDHAVLRCYLPAAAGHNLLMGAELTLAESWGGGPTVAEAGPPSVQVATPTSVRERLRRPTSLRFARETLEAALDQLSRDVGVEIVIRGADLQAEGITKNQSFAIDVENKPAEEILVEIVRLANPDKTAASPSDPRQKLVFVIAAGPDGSEQLFVTTRAAAAARGEELPAVFRSAKP
jgi:hypothetical protein